MKKAFNWLALCTLLLPVQSVLAAQITCGTTYSVKPSQSLTHLSVAAYDSAHKWQLIYYANRDLIGANPGRIFPGMELLIPCQDAPSPQAATQAEKVVVAAPSAPATAAQTVTTLAAVQPAAPAVQEQPASLRAPSNYATPKISLLTGSDYSPFTDPELPKGGMATEILDAALNKMGPNGVHRLDWINDWSAHLTPLLSERKYDIGFPWLKPDCKDLSALSSAMQERCEFVFTDPIFEMLVLMFKRTDDPLAPTTIADFAEVKVCRPEGYFLHDLDALGLVDGENFTLVSPRTVADCFRMLDDEQVDLVSLNEFTGRSAIATLDLKHEVTELDTFASVQGLHAVVHRLHPRATILVHHLNNALRTMHQDGSMQAIQTRHLEAYYNSLKTS